MPGRAEGRAEGVLDTSGLMKVIDAVGLIAPSHKLEAAETKALERWFGHYLEWMLTSANGKAERAAKNNHGLWYDAQIVHFALFARRPDLARETVLAFPRTRILAQFSPSGALPEELVRTRSFHYSVYSLEAAFDVAALAECLGYDLWRYSDPQGRSLRSATAYLATYRDRRGEWPYPEREWPAARLDALLARAASVWPSLVRDKVRASTDRRMDEQTRLTKDRAS